MPARTFFETEPNNAYTVEQADDAGTLAPNQPLILSGTLNASNDPIDYFTFTPTTDGTIAYEHRLHDYAGEQLLEGTFEVKQGQPAGFYSSIDEFNPDYGPGGNQDVNLLYDVSLFLIA